MRARITFSKQGALRYTGHLDLHRLWERAMRRAELPLAYSQGFHPQPKITIAAALPLGFSSRCEVIDLRLEQEIPLDGLREKLQETLPTGIQVANVESVVASGMVQKLQSHAACSRLSAKILNGPIERDGIASGPGDQQRRNTRNVTFDLIRRGELSAEVFHQGGAP